MVKINLVRKYSSNNIEAQSHRVTVEVVSSENITKCIFVKQRIYDYTKQNFQDVFVAVATPTQLEDFDENSPATGSSYFRSDKIDVVSRNADYLDSVFNDIYSQVQKLVEEVKALDVLATDGEYEITA